MIKVGDILHSKYFDSDIKVVKINSDTDWYFEYEGRTLKAQTSLSYWKEKNEAKT